MSFGLLKINPHFGQILYNRYSCILLKKLEPNIPAGKVNNATPIKAQHTVKNLPAVVTGYTSPKPVVVKVTIPNHKVAGMLENLSG
jgi:hypothetical protein